ncbi:uncharacterized protein JCM6883_002730 [Sporobolomyces salmoneus]|uniref:uncharacterized protein n=1 Tax=Sporobolomyces salmoneus TaxID=183962 RepID=UPI00316F7D18
MGSFYSISSLEIGTGKASTFDPSVPSKQIIFDLFSFFSTLQIVTWRMLKESAVFFVLLALFGIGFGQALMGLDVADERRDSTETVIHTLIQALLGSPNFDE